MAAKVSLILHWQNPSKSSITVCIEISPIRQVLPCYNTRRDVACVSWRLVRLGLLDTDLFVPVHNSLTVKFISCRQCWSRLSAKCSFNEMAITTSKRARHSRWDTFCSMWLRAGKFSFIVAKNVELRLKMYDDTFCYTRLRTGKFSFMSWIPKMYHTIS